MQLGVSLSSIFCGMGVGCFRGILSGFRCSKPSTMVYTCVTFLTLADVVSVAASSAMRWLQCLSSSWSAFQSSFVSASLSMVPKYALLESWPLSRKSMHAAWYSCFAWNALRLTFVPGSPVSLWAVHAMGGGVPYKGSVGLSPYGAVLTSGFLLRPSALQC